MSNSDRHEAQLMELHLDRWWAEWQLGYYQLTTKMAEDTTRDQRRRRRQRQKSSCECETCNDTWRRRKEKENRRRCLKKNDGDEGSIAGAAAQEEGELDRYETDTEDEDDDEFPHYHHDYVCRCREEALQKEVSHLQTELGKVFSVKVKLEGKMSEEVNGRNRLQAEVEALKAQLAALSDERAREKGTAAEAQTRLENALTAVTDERDQCRKDLKELSSRAKAAEHMSSVAATVQVQLQDRLTDVEKLLEDKCNELAAAQESWRVEQVAAEEDFKLLKQKYSALKLRLSVAAKKVDAVRGERDGLFKANVELKSQLGDVETFLHSDKGKLYNRLEENLAATRLSLVEVEADRDELLVRLNHHHPTAII